VFQRYASGAEKPVNDWKTLWPGCELRFEELEDVAALIGALHGQTPTGEAVSLMGRLYLQRDWSETERQAMRDRLVAIGTPAAALLRAKLKALTEQAGKSVDRRIAKWRSEGQVKLKHLQREIKPLAQHRLGIDSLAAELSDLAELIEAVAADGPSDERAKALCRIYVRHNWLAQRELIRDTLGKWGPGGTGTMRDFAKIDADWVKQRSRAIDADEAHSRATQRFGRGLETSLIRVDLARKDLADDYEALADLAAVIAASARPADVPEYALAQLCRIYTHRGWRKPNEAIAAVLAKGGPEVARAIQAQLKAAEADLAEAVKMKYMCLSDTVKSRYRWRYDRARALEVNLRKGIDALKQMAPGK